MTGQDVEKACTDHLFASGTVVGNGGVVRVGEREIDNVALLITHGFEDDVRVHERIERGRESSALFRELNE